MVRRFTHSLRTSVGSFDATMTNKFGSECTKKRFALVGGFVEFGDALAVAHGFDRSGSGKRWKCGATNGGGERGAVELRARGGGGVPCE